MKKLVFAFVAMAAMSFAFTTTSCNKGGAADTDSVVVEDTAAQDTAAQDSAAQDSTATDSVK